MVFGVWHSVVYILIHLIKVVLTWCVYLWIQLCYISEDDKKDLPNEQEPNDTEEEEETTKQKSTTKQLTYEEAASQGMKSYAKLMYDNEGGIAPFYSGVITSAVQSATEKALYFFAYTFYKNGWVCIYSYR